jgi:hypothetical protein
MHKPVLFFVFCKKRFMLSKKGTTPFNVSLEIFSAMEGGQMPLMLVNQYVLEFADGTCPR